MNDLPIILVVSSSHTKPKSIIRLLTKENPEEGNLVQQTWKIDTKYYTAVVNFVGLNQYEEQFDGRQVEALLIHMDTNKSTGLEDLKQWEHLESKIKPEVKLLLANYCNDDTKITRNEALIWCSSRGFELVELYPSDVDCGATLDLDDRRILPEKRGSSRVLEALQAHTWSNLVRKKVLSFPKKPLKNDIQEEDFLGDDNFTELFNQLHTMKDGLQSLPMAQRQHCAQQMVTAFWHAIGGDDDELLDV